MKLDSACYVRDNIELVFPNPLYQPPQLASVINLQPSNYNYRLRLLYSKLVDGYLEHVDFVAVESFARER